MMIRLEYDTAQLQISAALNSIIVTAILLMSTLVLLAKNI